MLDSKKTCALCWRVIDSVVYRRVNKNGRPFHACSKCNEKLDQAPNRELMPSLERIDIFLRNGGRYGI